ncbi:hypothetical protein ACNSZH_28120 [Burkholderia gladioli]|uniref:hypothetical protein n=1 Tax=Burkholderia gladioli TaxID=28095 RepID=UPI003B9823C1
MSKRGRSPSLLMASVLLHPFDILVARRHREFLGRSLARLTAQLFFRQGLRYRGGWRRHGGRHAVPRSKRPERPDDSTDDWLTHAES